MCNDDQSLRWGLKGENIMKQKSKGAGIMVSDYIDEHNGFLALTNDEYERAKTTHPRIKPYAREFLEYGESKEGYWTRDRFMDQMERAVTIAGMYIFNFVIIIIIIISFLSIYIQRSSTLRKTVGDMYGCSTIAVATLLWLTMHLTSTK